MTHSTTPICRDCAHYCGQLHHLLPAMCRHPVNTAFDVVEGEHIVDVQAREMRAEGGRRSSEKTNDHSSTEA